MNSYFGTIGHQRDMQREFASRKDLTESNRGLAEATNRLSDILHDLVEALSSTGNRRDNNTPPMITTGEAVNLIEEERERQKEIGTDGIHVSRNDLIADVLVYLGRATEGSVRNKREGHDPQEMLVKAGALMVALVESAEREKFA